MTTKELLQQTQTQVRQLAKNRKGIKFPQSLKDSIIKLSNKMNASAIARAIGVSSTFACTVVRLERINKSTLISSNKDKRVPSKENLNSKKITDNNNLQILDITDQFKSIMNSSYAKV